MAVAGNRQVTLQIMLSRLPGVGHLPRIEEGNGSAARSRTGAGPVDAHAPRLVESAAAACTVGRRRVEVGAGPCLQGVCRQVPQQGGQRKRPGAVVGRFPLRWRQVADINPGRGRQRFAGFHHQDPRGAAIGNPSFMAPAGPLPIISTSMFSSISVHAFVVLRAHARCRCTEIGTTALCVLINGSS